jgi:hypothetical protein
VSQLRAFVARHDEGMRYLVALTAYVVFGAFIFKLVFNWIAGPVWALLFVWYVPMKWRAARARRTAS